MHTLWDGLLQIFCYCYLLHQLLGMFLTIMSIAECACVNVAYIYILYIISYHILSLSYIYPYFLLHIKALFLPTLFSSKYQSISIYIPKGHSALVGVFLLSLLLPLNAVCFVKLSKFKRQIATLTDRRLRLVNEVKLLTFDVIQNNLVSFHRCSDLSMLFSWCVGVIWYTIDQNAGFRKPFYEVMRTHTSAYIYISTASSPFSLQQELNLKLAFWYRLFIA